MRTARISPAAAMAIVSAMLSSCDRDAVAARPITMRVGDAAFTLDVPQSLVARPLAGGGIRLAPPDVGQLRRPTTVQLTAGDGRSPISLRHARGNGDARILFGVARADGGSGGAEVTLIAERPCGAGRVRLRPDQQIEPPETADVDGMLDMFARARCRAAG
ncbi:Tsi3 family protein [Sphingomonas sp. ASY06-1R]|jgi:hypothetical protein|uniref:Tsi3 family protein n=1 Tax=Sphingomonas sp. ASY06-1R TaxID=3445771 RepID=UPI003FA2E4FF